MHLNKTTWFRCLQWHLTKHRGKMEATLQDFTSPNVLVLLDGATFIKGVKGSCVIPWQTLDAVQIISRLKLNMRESRFKGSIGIERTVQVLLPKSSLSIPFSFQTSLCHPHDYDTWAKVSCCLDSHVYLVNTSLLSVKFQTETFLVNSYQEPNFGKLFSCFLVLISYLELITCR